MSTFCLNFPRCVESLTFSLASAHSLASLLAARRRVCGRAVLWVFDTRSCVLFFVCLCVSAARCWFLYPLLTLPSGGVCGGVEASVRAAAVPLHQRQGKWFWLKSLALWCSGISRSPERSRRRSARWCRRLIFYQR